jgi:hypothetical protein
MDVAITLKNFKIMFILVLNSIWKTEEVPDQWKESVIVPIHKKGNKTD